MFTQALFVHVLQRFKPKLTTVLKKGTNITRWSAQKSGFYRERVAVYIRPLQIMDLTRGEGGGDKQGVIYSIQVSGSIAPSTAPPLFE